MPGGVAVGVLVAVIAVVPVEDVQAAVGADLLRHRHEPGVVGGQEVGTRSCAEYVEPSRVQLVDVDAVAVDVAHVEPFAILRRIGVAVEADECRNRRPSGAVLDDRVDLPGERRIGAALAVVVAGLGEVPEVIDDAGA